MAETGRLQTAEFDKLAMTCEAANTRDGEAARSEAMSYYARVISNTELAPLEQLLQRTCRPDHIAGCDSLAFFSSPFTLTGQGLRFHGTDQPEKRLAALRIGCQPGALGLSNCKDLGDVLAERGDHIGAQESYRMAWTASRQSDGARSDRGACFTAGLHALTKIQDPATARLDFEAVCADNSDSNQPYACKHLALLHMDRTDAQPDLPRTLDLLKQACFPQGDFKGDGEGCLDYGRTLFENRNQLRYDPTASWIMTMATRAYVIGCLSRWQAAFAANTRLYSPGMRLFELGQIFRSQNHFLDLLNKRLQQLCADIGHTGYITVFDGSDLMVLRMIRGSNPLAIATAPGYRTAAHSTSNGRAMLALLEDAEWRRRVPEPLPFVSKKTPVDHAELQEILGGIRSTGRSSAEDESYPGVSAFGVAMVDHETGEIYGVALSIPTSLMTPELREEALMRLERLRVEMRLDGNED